MILHVDLRTGEVRDPAIGVVGKTKMRYSMRNAVAQLPPGTILSVVIEIDDAKVNQKRDRSVF